MHDKIKDIAEEIMEEVDKDHRTNYESLGNQTKVLAMPGVEMLSNTTTGGGGGSFGGGGAGGR